MMNINKSNVNLQVVEQVSQSERIVSTARPDGKIVFVHQFLDINKWKTCLECGKKIGTSPGAVLKIEHFKRYCPKYRSTLKDQ